MNFKKVVVTLLLFFLVVLGVFYGTKRIAYPYCYEEYVNEFSQKYEVDPLLVLSVMKCESKFNSNALSVKGAKGLMQIMDDTGQWIAKEVEIDNFTPNMLYDPRISIELGAWYINNLLNEFGTLEEALAAYNAGSGNVNKWLNSPDYSKDGNTLYFIPFKETKKYVDKVKTNYNIYKYFYKEK